VITRLRAVGLVTAPNGTSSVVSLTVRLSLAKLQPHLFAP
jgi:hypothetical protein